MRTLKFVAGTDNVVEGLAIPFGGPFNGRDLDGEYFTTKTDLCLDWFETRPSIYHHGLDADAKTAVVGRVTDHEMREDGVWAQVQLDRSNSYFTAIHDLIDQGKLYFSTGAMAHLVQKAKSGEILRWPWVELSFTPTPANPLAVLDFATAKSHFKAANIDFSAVETAIDAVDDRDDALKAVWSTAMMNDLPDSCFAYISPGGSKDADGKTTPRSLRHLPYRDADGKPDAAHVRNALARLDQTDIPDAAKAQARGKLMAAAHDLGIHTEVDDSNKAARSVKALEGSYEDLLDDLAELLNVNTPFGPSCYNSIVATFPDYVIVHRCEYTDSPTDLDDTYWKVAYSIGEDGEPVLGASVQVDQTYVPTKAHAYDGPLVLDATSLSRHASALAARTKAVSERRGAEGRFLSLGNARALSTVAADLAAAQAAITDLLTASEDAAAAKAKAEALSTPEARARDLELLRLFAQTI